MVGLSDHTLGNLVASASVLYGVSAIEKHFTYDKTLPDSADHWLSLDAAELKELVENTKILNSSKGGMTKKALECEGSTHMYARRSIVSSRLLKANEIITEDMISYKRPGTGISPKYYKDLIGKRVLKDVPGDSLIQETDFE